MKNNSFQEIWGKLKNSKKILMSLHNGPDGDSLGSCTALKYVLERDLNSKVVLVSPDNLDQVLSKLPFSKDINFGKSISQFNLKEFDVLLFLDQGAIFYDKKDIKINLKDIFIINIDHHVTNSFYGNLNYVNVEQPSVCSILLDFLKINKIKFDRELSRRLLLGICTDTDFFKHGNINKSLKDVSFLIDNGANYTKDIVQPILDNQPLKMKKYYALLINNLKINKQKKFGYSSISYKNIKNLNLNLSEIRLGIAQIQDLDEIDFLFTLVEMKDSIKGSFRSRKNVDVSLFAKALGGGGHKPAAAFMLSKMPLKRAEKIVIESIRKIGVHKY